MGASDNALEQKIIALEQELALYKSQQDSGLLNFEFLFNAIKQPAFLIESKKPSGTPLITKINKSGLELIKYSQSEVENLNPVDIGLFDSSEQFANFCNSLSTAESAIFLAKIKPKNDITISSEVTIFCFSNEVNFQVLAFQRNIGNQQKVVEALRQSEYRFLQMAENVAEGIIIIDEDKKVFINSSMCQITGYSKDDLRDMDEFSLAHADEKDRLTTFKEKIKHLPHGTHSIEYWITTRQQHDKCLKSNYSITRRSDGKKSTYIITSDITSRKKIEQALRKSQSEFRMLAENSPDIITRYNKDLTYTYTNQTMERLTGIPVSHIIGSNNLELDLDPELISFLEEMHLEVFRTGRTLKFEFRIPIAIETKVFQAHMVPELSNEGTVVSVLNIARDITQIKQVERNLTEEKLNLIQENQMIAQKLREWCSILCENNQMVSENSHCLKPILKIADWAEYGHVQEHQEPKTIVVNKLLQNFFNEHSQTIEQHNLQANLILPVHEITVFSDEQMLKNTLLLLLENALEATDTGKIEIGYDIYNENEIVFLVKDTGIGIEPEQTENIFKPFVSQNKVNHAGLGLSIAQKYVESMNGVIWCLSSPGTGSTFCFTHPALIEKSLLQSKIDNQHSDWKGKKVLIVEDTQENYQLLIEILKKYELDLSRAETGHQAIELLKTNANFDLVLMDIQLPGINGYEATREIRKFNTKIPIIAQTAYAMYDDVVRALDAGCNDFIAKPIKTKKFLGLVGKYLSR
ncbi:MAG: PAS domain S-box protein [Salinivirgaceae bacterium]